MYFLYFSGSQRCHCHQWWQEWGIMVSLISAQRSQPPFGKRAHSGGVSHSNAHLWNTAQLTPSQPWSWGQVAHSMPPIGKPAVWELPWEGLLHMVAHTAPGSSLRISRYGLASPCFAMWSWSLKLVLRLHKVLADLQARWTYLVSSFQWPESPSWDWFHSYT